MAIQIAYSDEFGVTHLAAYCKLADVNTYYNWGKSGEIYDHADVYIHVFHNKTARDTKKVPLMVKYFKIENISSITLTGYESWRNLLYAQIKADEFFTSRNGIDV